MQLLLVLMVWGLCLYSTQADCSDHNNCKSCANDESWIGSCRWCEDTRSCHQIESGYDECFVCSNNSLSTKCSITEQLDCGANIKDGDETKNFDAKEAYDALLLSAIAYSDDPTSCMGKHFRTQDLQLVEVIGMRCNDMHFDYKECFAFIAVSKFKHTIYISFRGTSNPEKMLRDNLTNFNSYHPSKIGGKIHSYFSTANRRLYSCVSQGISDVLKTYTTYKIVIVGHSVGGALASITSAELLYDGLIYDHKTTLYTFGMPRPGDKQYAKKHDIFVPNSYRVVHYKDIISKSPPRDVGSFHHQLEIFYGEEMDIRSHYVVCEKYEDERCVNGESHIESIFAMPYHKTYYEITVGSYCQMRAGSNKDKEKQSALYDLFNDKTCRRIKKHLIPTNKACIQDGTAGVLTTLMLICAAWKL